MYLILTIINVLIFLSWLTVVRYFRVPWRAVLAMLPTPMLGFASSYGVYAFNARLTPEWVAIVMAAAYEVTYIGIAAFVNLSTSQVDKGNAIARDAAIISFCQNAIAGLFHVQPGLLVYNTWPDAWPLAVNLPLALLHAAQVWIAYRAANFTLHGSQVDEKAVNVDGFQVDDLIESSTILPIRRPPLSLLGPRPRRQLPAPVQLDASTAAERLAGQPTRRRVDALVDDRVDDWIAQNDAGTSYAKISAALGGSPSKQFIGAACKTRRRQLEKVSVNR